MSTNLARRHTQLNYGPSKTISATTEESQHGQKRVLTRSEETTSQPSKIQRLNRAIKGPNTLPLSFKSSSPWTCLDRLFTQNGMTICHGKMYAQPQVAVRKRKCNAKDLKSLAPQSHEHLVKMFDVFFEDEVVYLVYEYMDVSLRNIASLPQRLGASEISMICKAVCSGLSYVHDTLRISFGNLDGKKVLVNRSGNVKIANAGDALLKDRSVADSSVDIRSVGLIMVELMEHTTSVIHPNEHKVTNPERWEKDGNILTFLADTQTSTLEQLLAHDFIPKTPDYSRLSFWVILAQMNAYIKTECLVPDGKAI